ncbi:hypothetical protein A2U01_0054671, partial [Trifolium medium]|nr:hypothetical protein [Trifolium medium]
NFLEDFKKETGVDVPRSMVPPTPNVDLYKPRKRKRSVKTSEEEPKKKEMKKEIENVAEKKKVIEKKEMIVAEAGKKKDKKRKSVGIKIDEGKSKRRQEKRAKKNDLSTESDEETLAQRLKHKTLEAYAKEMHQKFSK